MGESRGGGGKKGTFVYIRKKTTECFCFQNRTKFPRQCKQDTAYVSYCDNDSDDNSLSSVYDPGDDSSTVDDDEDLPTESVSVVVVIIF